VKIVPYVSEQVDYLPADEEDKYTIAQANAPLDEKSQFVGDRVEARLAERYVRVSPVEIDFMDVSPKQIFSVAASLVPFLEHDDANRALMDPTCRGRPCRCFHRELLSSLREWKPKPPSTADRCCLPGKPERLLPLPARR
jgi:DNA-directed RNA polymerase beta subunit